MTAIFGAQISPLSNLLQKMDYSHHHLHSHAFPSNWTIPQTHPTMVSAGHQSPMFYSQAPPPTPSPISPPIVRSSPAFLSRGYVACTFGSSASRTFWASVLKVLPEQIHPQAIAGASPYWRIDPHDVSAGESNAGRMLDYLATADYVSGPVVPQRLWQPLYRRIREVLVDNSRLCMPIFFVMQETGVVGLSLNDALAKKHYLLHGHNHAVDLGGKVTTHIRILWKGYQEYKRQIQIQDQTRDRNPITLGRLVEHVARTVQRFVERPPELSEDDYDVQWRVGAQGITTDDIVLVGVLHTSAGTWQPILRLSRPLPHTTQSGQALSSAPGMSSAGAHQLLDQAPLAYPSSPESYSMSSHSPSPQHVPRSYPPTPHPQVAYSDGYLAQSPYSAFPYT